MFAFFHICEHTPCLTGLDTDGTQVMCPISIPLEEAIAARDIHGEAGGWGQFKHTGHYKEDHAGSNGGRQEQLGGSGKASKRR